MSQPFPATPVERFTKVRVTSGNWKGFEGYVEGDNRHRPGTMFAARGVKIMLYEGARQVGCYHFRTTESLELLP